MSEECEGVKKLTTLGSSRKKPCRHSWLIDHTIYQHPTSKVGLTMHRQCKHCGTHELCKVSLPAWSRATKGWSLPDLRK